MVTKLTIDEARRRFDLAETIAQRIPVDRSDPSYNLVAAMDNYCGSNAAGINELIRGVNDILERLERIENTLKLPAVQRRP